METPTLIKSSTYFCICSSLQWLRGKKTDGDYNGMQRCISLTFVVLNNVRKVDRHLKSIAEVSTGVSWDLDPCQTLSFLQFLKHHALKDLLHKYSRSPSQSVMTLLGYDRRLPQLGWDWSSRMPVEGRNFQYIGDISLLNMQHVLFVRILIVPQSLLRGSSSFLALLPKHHGLLYTSVQVGMLHVLHPEILKSIPSV